jgi:DNA invertase Pin-like site-specific DNA recombinase
MSGMVTTVHLSRRAIVYVRQSTTAQMFDHQESTRRQYGLVERALALGWIREAIEVIDEDQGRSGATTEGRTGFARMVAAVAQGIVGALFALEVSRLARSSEDWRRLLALCAVAQVLVIDEQTVYDPKLPDDKLLLDIKGTMSEVELHWLGLRLTGACTAKARRGALRIAPPTGYIWTEHGLTFDPDEAVRSAIATLFARYAVSPSGWAVVRWARMQGFLVPTRHTHTDGTSDVTWQPLGISRFHEMLGNPVYSGAYVYGRRPIVRALVDGQIKRVRGAGRDPATWRVLLRDAHPGYISWVQYEANQARLRANSQHFGNAGTGAPREGPALLAGLAICGRCGRRMTVAYQPSARGYWIYHCAGTRDKGQVTCWSVPGRAIDAAVTSAFLDAVVPRELDLSLAVRHDADAQTATLTRHWATRVEQARYEARHAERRYKAVDPDNRVVARTLEQEWEQRLRDLDEVERAAATARETRMIDLTDAERANVRALARDLPAVWNATTTTPADRKAMLRLVIEAIALVPIEVPLRETTVRLQWRSGVVSELKVVRWTRLDTFATSEAACARIRTLAAEGLHDADIATQLNTEGILSGRGRSWTVSSVRWVRRRVDIKRTAPDRPRTLPLPDRHPDGRYSISGAARAFGISTHVVRRLLKNGDVQGTFEPYGTYQRICWLTIDDAAARQLARLAAHTHHP